MKFPSTHRQNICFLIAGLLSFFFLRKKAFLKLLQAAVVLFPPACCCMLDGLALAAQGAAPEEALDLYCLKLSYPQIKSVRTDSSVNIILNLQSGQGLPYKNSPRRYASSLDADLRESLAQPYPLEPERPPTPAGFAPGRKRPYSFLEAVYGHDKSSVQSKLITQKFLSSRLSLSANAAMAFANASPSLLSLAKSGFAEYLKPEGAFYWRKIAGENVPSAHSWGIAVDMGLKKSPYWRWSRERPHPKQKSYPGEVVKAMEEHGFIWGGKWHEYDLMHFEYRPELICKARMQRFITAASKGNFSGVTLKGGKKRQ